MTPAVGYIRVSTDEQAESGLGLEAQEHAIRAYAGLYGLALVRLERDDGWSGKSLARPGLTAARAALAAGEVKALVFSKLDRLTRSVRDFGLVVEEAEAQRWALHSVAEKLDTTTASGRMVANVMVSFAQFERETTGERTKAALAALKRRGARLGRAPYGYSHANVQGKRVMVPVPAEQEVLALCQEWADSGLTLREMASELMIRQIPARDGGLRWGTSSVACVMRTLREVQNSHGALRVSEAQGILQGN